MLLVSEKLLVLKILVMIVVLELGEKNEVKAKVQKLKSKQTQKILKVRMKNAC